MNAATLWDSTAPVPATKASQAGSMPPRLSCRDTVAPPKSSRYSPLHLATISYRFILARCYEGLLSGITHIVNAMYPWLEQCV